MDVNRFIQEEVTRQGYLAWTPSWLRACMNMARAWAWWETEQIGLSDLNWELVEELGSKVNPEANGGGLRRVNVTIAETNPPVKFAPWYEVPRLLGIWVEAVCEKKLNANEAYIQLLGEIHPFADGNGRMGKILFNWLNETLGDPVLPIVPEEWRIP